MKTKGVETKPIKDFGRDRCFDTPFEESMTGVGIGAAILVWSYFSTSKNGFCDASYEPISEYGSKIHYIQTKTCVPLVVRTCIERHK